MNEAFIELEVHGDGYERGLEHGRQVKDFILPRWGRMLENMKSLVGKEKILTEVDAWMKKNFPDLVEEMRGIADGADMSHEDVFMLNNAKMLGAYRSGCSNLGLADSSIGPALIGTVDGGTPPMRSPMFIQRFYPKRGYRVLGTVLPGCIWVEKAVNERGVAIGNSSVETKGFRTDGLPIHTLFREALLACGTTREAVEFLTRHHQNGASSVIVVVDANGDLGCVEKTPTKTAVRTINEGFVSAANAFLEEPTRALALDEPEKRHERIGRYKVLNEFGEKLYPNGTVNEFRDCLRYHGEPAYICRHGGKDLSETYESYIVQCDPPGMFVGEKGFCCETKLDRFFSLERSRS